MKKVMTGAKYLFTLVMLVVISCSMSANDSLVGKWQQTLDEQGVKIVTIYDFHADGTLSQHMDMSNSSTPRMKMVADGVCKYTFQNNTITFKFNPQDFNFSTFEVEGLDQATTDAILEQTKTSMTAMEQKITNVKIDGNKLTGTFNGQEFVLTRM